MFDNNKIIYILDDTGLVKIKKMKFWGLKPLASRYNTV